MMQRGNCSKRQAQIKARVLSASSRNAIIIAAQVLQGGGIVAFPTETVYGLAARTNDRAASERLRRTKLRPVGRPFQLIVSSSREAAKRSAKWSSLALKLARAFWPGPLTLVVKGTNNRWIGMRVPDHRIAKRLAKTMGGALVATSANISGSKPARNACDVLTALGPHLDIVLDAGECAVGKASSVVRVRGDKWELLREGAISRKEIMKVAGDPSQKER